MAISRQVDLLEPVNLADHLTKVELYLGQVCQIAGISKMQLDYWTNKAQIPTKGKKQRIYDIEALETVMLIKQAKDKGLNLGAAIEAARRFREERSLRRGEQRDGPGAGEKREAGGGGSSRRRPVQRTRGPRSSPPRLAQLPAQRPLGRHRVDPPAGAELDSGEDPETREHLDVPVGRVVQPGVQRQRPDDLVQAPHRLAEKLECERELLVDEASGARLGGRDHDLVREATRVRTGDDEAFALGDDRPAARDPPDAVSPAAARGSQTSCECVCGRLDPAWRPSFTSAWR